MTEAEYRKAVMKAAKEAGWVDDRPRITIVGEVRFGPIYIMCDGTKVEAENGCEAAVAAAAVLLVQEVGS